MYRKALILFSTAALLVGCDAFGPEDVQVQVQTDATSYIAPAGVGVRLVNMSAGTIHHGVCPGLEQRVDGAWIPFQYDEDQVPSCPAVLVVTKPRHQKEFSVYIEKPGEYRLLLWVSTSDDERVDTPFISNGFTVESGTD